ncbi:hypothetical protein SUDANB105_02489 [Streptomyces sp. enrichment culture]|uniref:hypothetical protein n=1 Tax=Streptomyces sp. enrichment culture TaxID=1795815 RepID=UPI003F55580E
MDSDKRVCPACGQPVETFVRRHKTLGAWVPTWVAGPCRNPRCQAYAAEGSDAAEERHGRAAEQTRHTGHAKKP